MYHKTIATRAHYAKKAGRILSKANPRSITAAEFYQSVAEILEAQAAIMEKLERQEQQCKCSPKK